MPKFNIKAAPPAQPTPVADGADVPITDAMNVPIPDADRSRSPHGLSPDLSEFDLSADLGRVMEHDQQLAEAMDSLRRRESEFELSEAARTRQFMEQYASDHCARLQQLELEAKRTTQVATQALVEG